MLDTPGSRRRGVLFGAAGALLAAGYEPARADTPEGLVLRLAADPMARDQSKAIQTAIEEVQAAGGGRVELGRGIFSCLSGPLYLDPTKTSLIGDRSVLDFSHARFNPKMPAALVVAPPPGAQQYGQATQRIEGLSLRGTGDKSTAAAILFRADQPGLSSRISLYNINITGFQDGLRFEDRAYLIQVYSTAISGCVNSIMVPPSLQDAGENMAFFGCTLSAGGVAVRNQAGFEFNFFGTSFDFTDQWYVGDGAANFHGCHFETAKPLRPAPLFDVEGDGILNFHGGTIMVSGNDFDPSPKNAAVFHLAGARSRAVLSETSVYNLRSSSGAMGTGAGRLITRNLNGGAVKEIDAVPMNASKSDLFGRGGEFLDSTMRIEADLTSDPQSDTDRYHARYGAISLQSGAMQIDKTGSIGNELLARLFCPIQPLRMPSVQLRWKPYGAKTNEDAIFWITLSAVQKIGVDRAGKAVIGTSETLGPLQTLRAVFNGNRQEWFDVAIDTLTMNAYSPTDGYTSEWVTHLCISIELINLPANSGIMISDLHAYSL